MKRPVLIDIELIGHASQSVNPQLLPALAELNQADRPLVLLAERPDRWKPTRNRVDLAFKQQADIEAMINRGGGMLDAILYLDFSLFSRLRQRKVALVDLAERYDCELQQMIAITSDQGRMLDTLIECKLPQLKVNKKHSLKQRIHQVLGQNRSTGKQTDGRI